MRGQFKLTLPRWGGRLGEFGLFAPGVKREVGEKAAVYVRVQGGVGQVLRTGLEHILMLDGSQQDEKGIFGPGNFVVNPPGSRHSVRSEEGCTALLIWERPVRFIENGLLGAPAIECTTSAEGGSHT